MSRKAPATLYGRRLGIEEKGLIRNAQQLKDLQAEPSKGQRQSP